MDYVEDEEEEDYLYKKQKRKTKPGEERKINKKRKKQTKSKSKSKKKSIKSIKAHTEVKTFDSKKMRKRLSPSTLTFISLSGGRMSQDQTLIR